ncbi:MAG: 50S ribosomal protein L17 [Patescibacteria group bacterium]
MVKRVFGRKLSRERSSRELLFVSLIESLVHHGQIKTTKAKAKSIIGLIDRLVVLAKKGTLASKRQILKRLKGNKEISTLFWTNIAKIFETRNGGYTRIIPLTQRKGDMAEMVRIEWTEKMKSNVGATKKNENISTKTKRS